jgi:hypothetical protein
MLLDLCKGLKFVIFSFAVFHGVHSYYSILWIFAEEQYGLGGGVDEAAGASVRHLGQGEPGPLPGRGQNLHKLTAGTGQIRIRNSFGSATLATAGKAQKWNLVKL